MNIHFSMFQLLLGVFTFIAAAYIYVKNIRNELS
ncbi:MAG: hypothetical protein K0R69_1692 [Clostridia bacterium]|nr:hypothetical protein [Clostridia bacterium]